MSHAIGTHLGGVRTHEDLRGRCVIDDDTGCWHLRTANGRPMPRDKVHRVYMWGRGALSALRVAWELKTGQPVPAGQVVYRTCSSYDCIRHITSGTKAEQGEHQRKTGALRGTVAASIRNTRVGQALGKITPELALWAMESDQTLREAAHGLGVTTNVVWRVRRGISWRAMASGSSVFGGGAHATSGNGGR